MAKNQIEIDIVKKPHSKSEYTDENQIELERCAEDPIYFIENFVRIQHPIKGNVPFILYPFQREMILAYHKYKSVCLNCGRQLGKTSTSAAYLLWKAMFTDDCTILVTANKVSQAIEIMDRAKFSYEHLPNYIRAGVTEYNKQSVSFDNGSKIVCRATTKDAGRGLSITCVSTNSYITVRNKITNEISYVKIKDILK